MNKKGNGLKPISQTAIIETAGRKAKDPEIVTPSAPPAAVAPDLLLSAKIDTGGAAVQAHAEGLETSNAFAARRVSELSQRDIMAKTLKIKQIARAKRYKLAELVHSPDVLSVALDDFDLTCFDLGLFPLQNLLAVWLNTTQAQLMALASAANVSESGELIAAHSDYCVSVISSAAIAADKPPVFSIYYLKTAYRMFDNAPNLGTNGAIMPNFTQNNITINAADISKNSKIFAEIDAAKGVGAD